MNWVIQSAMASIDSQGRAARLAVGGKVRGHRLPAAIGEKAVLQHIAQMVLPRPVQKHDDIPRGIKGAAPGRGKGGGFIYVQSHSAPFCWASCQSW